MSNAARLTKLLQPFHGLRGADKPASAAAHRIARLADGRAVAFGAGFGEKVGRAACGAFGQVHIADFRDNIARAVDLHPVAHADIAAFSDRGTFGIAPGDVIFVVQRRVRDDHAPPP